VVVAHANIIRCFISRAMGDSVVKWARLTLTQGSLTVMTLGPTVGRVLLVSYNDVGHLPPKMCTFL
jgi:broad specificity phosphatase PhoE